MKLSPSRKLVSLLIILLAVASVPLAAQTSATDGVLAPQIDSPRIPPPAYGTSSTVDYVAGAMEFLPRISTSLPLTVVSGSQYRAGTANVYYDAAAHLPTGASVVGIEIQGCDNSATNQIIATINICNQAGVCSLGGTVGSGNVNTGCTYYGNLAIVPFTVNNYNNTYLVEVNLTDTVNSIAGIRLYYKLQVSPPPSVATFTDVPLTSPYNKFVEALVAAGITGGCGGGNYCPDAPVTRGQIAVFLSAALGLHWVD